MATLGELSVLLSVKGASKFKLDLAAAGEAAKLPGITEGRKGLETFGDRLKGLKKDLGGFARDLKLVQTSLKNFGIQITGTFTAAFIAAGKEIPEVSYQLPALKNASQEVSNTLAQAALPTLKDFIGGLNSFSNLLKKIDPQIINQILKFRAWALAVSFLIGRMIDISKIFRFFVTPL